MALSRDFVRDHIARWEAQLQNPFQPHRAKWPRRLFHHSPLENVVQILTAGVLRSRQDPANHRAYDVAGAGVIDARVEAHEYVRMYFRPNTPTQYHIEGIRRPSDCDYGVHAHAPMLVMLLLRAEHVLTQPDVQFSDRNMQLGGVNTGNTEQFFASIPFQYVFHEGGIGGNRDIVAHRCAEVLAVSPLLLHDSLEAICFRSEAEKTTALSLLGNAANQWRDRMWVSEDLKLFQRRFPFVRSASITRAGLILSLNPRHDMGMIDLKVLVRDTNGRVVLDRWYNQLPSVPPQGDKWRVGDGFADGLYTIEIKIEDRLAFYGEQTVGDVIF